MKFPLHLTRPIDLLKSEMIVLQTSSPDQSRLLAILGPQEILCLKRLTLGQSSLLIQELSIVSPILIYYGANSM